MRLVSDFTFASELDETSACETRSLTLTVCPHIWPCCKQRKCTVTAFILSASIKNNNNSRCSNGAAMAYPYTNIKISSCCGIRSQILVGHVGGSMTLSVRSQS